MLDEAVLDEAEPDEVEPGASPRPKATSAHSTADARRPEASLRWGFGPDVSAIQPTVRNTPLRVIW